jgi:hypothetical protein
MSRIHIGGAGGAPSNNVIRSLRESDRGDYLIGTSSVPTDLFLADVDEKHVVLPATHPDYRQNILQVLAATRPDFLHVQHDFEVRAISRIRDEIHQFGTKTFLPSAQTVENCVDKFLSYEIWCKAGLRIPRTLRLNSIADLRSAFDTLGSTIWIRATEGGGGQGAVPTDNFEFARLWIDRYQGWGQFSAAELLTDRSVTWLSIWFNGELVVAQGRQRRSWNFGNRAVSGVTGITGVAETVSDPIVDRVAMDAVLAIDPCPHGLFGVDMTYDHSGFPNPTEINIGRFFTTVYFFTKAGLNLPEIYCDIALSQKFPSLERKLNPLPPGLIWIRGMDTEPVLTSVAELEAKTATWTI